MRGSRGPRHGAPIPSNYLAKKGEPWVQVRLLDICTFLVNVHAGAKREDVGFEDAGRTLDQLTMMLNKKALLSPSVIESCLWSCNLMNEAGVFWDSKDRTLPEYIKYVLGSEKYNLVYNTLERKAE